MMNIIKVVIIDQSISVCNKMKAIIHQKDNIEVVGIATNLNKGLKTIQATSPDVVLLDVNIPKLNNITALETILESKTLPIIILSANTVNQTAKTVKAMSNGAVDFIRKLNGTRANEENYTEEIITKINNASKIKRIRLLPKENKIKQSPYHDEPDKKLETKSRNKQTTKKSPIIAIGTSTGGPRALQKIIEDIPKDFTVPILIVQHMPARFTSSLATRLNNIGHIRVKEAKHGEIIQKGTAYIAPGDYHMVVKSQVKELKIELNQDVEESGHRPSVDVLFASIANIEHVHKIAVVLTGMGKDGANGVLEIKRQEKEAIIIAESKETAVIDGMPNATIATNCVTEIIRLDEIGKALVDYSK